MILFLFAVVLILGPNDSVLVTFSIGKNRPSPERISFSPIPDAAAISFSCLFSGRSTGLPSTRNGHKNNMEDFILKMLKMWNCSNETKVMLRTSNWEVMVYIHTISSHEYS